MEQVLERIAIALENGVEIMKKDLEVHNEMAGLYRELVRSKGGNVNAVEKVVDCEVVEAPVAVDDRKAREEEYERLKAELIARGVEVKPRTKLTTLQQLWEQYKDTPTESEDAEPELPVVQKLDTATAEEEPAAVDPFAEEPKADEGGIPCDMAPEEARALVISNYDSKSGSDKANLMKALDFVGVNTWLAIPEGKHGVVAARYLELKGISL